MKDLEKATAARDHTGAPVRILIAVTSAMAWVFSERKIGMLRDAGFEPILVSAPGEQLQRIAVHFGVQYAAIRMRREIAPVHDLVSLWRLYRLMRQVRPTIADVGTPKAGLLGGIAAWFLGVPCRIYTLHGLRLETARGLKRILLTLTERTACACAHRVICMSPSLRQRAIELKLVSAEKAVVLASGSYGGVDVERFSPKVRDSAQEDHLAETLGIPRGAPVVGFVGRFTRDKGIQELIKAFSQLRRSWPTLRLLLVGDFEDGDPVRPHIRQEIESHPCIIRTGFVSDTATYYRLMDLLVLPSYREGFPSAPLEAQACGLPVVTTTATGAIDSIVDGVTGFHVPVGNYQALATRIDQLLRYPELRSRMGQTGREWVVQCFRQEVVGQAWIEEYRRLLRGKGAQHIRDEVATPAAQRGDEVEKTGLATS
jgi:glycosyltransferase involved in cell wall biosynthesis